MSTVMLEQCSTEGIDVGIWVLDLSNGSQNTGDRLEAGSGQVTDVVFPDVPVCESLEMHESRIGVSENSVAVARDNSTFLQGLANVLLDNAFVGFFSFVVVSQFSQPFQAFLVGQTV